MTERVKCFAPRALSFCPSGRSRRLNPAKLPEHATLVFVTPSHQFPTGAILPLARRFELLKWARRKNSIIVENDHDGEFHYEGRPLESLQGLDREGRIVYLGTSHVPCFRLSASDI